MPQTKLETTLITPAPLATPEVLPGNWWNVHSNNELPPSYYGQLIWRYRWQILTFVVLVTTITSLVVFSLHKEYDATAILRIDPSGVRTVAESDTSGSAVPMSAESLIETEASELSSPAVVIRTVRELQLYRMKEFNPLGYASTAPPSEDTLLSVANAVKGGISVNNPSSTYLLNVTYRSLDPTLSANIANDLLQTLIQQDYETRSTALMGASNTMRAQLVDLRARMERAQSDLVQYESANDVLNPDSATNVMQSSLQQVNQELGQARDDRINLQGLYDTVKDGDLDGLMASKPGASLVPLYQQFLGDQKRLAQMGEVYGPNYPVYRQQQAVVQQDQATLASQQKHVAGQIKAQYVAAQASEKLLRNELQSQKRQMDDFNRKAVRYNALKAAATSYTNLYYQLQQQIQDAAVAANLKAENLRVISPAHPVSMPVYPRTMLSIAAAFLLSLFLGAAAAVAVGMLDRSVATAEQVEHLFHLPLLAALPAVTSKGRRELAPVGYGPQTLQGGSNTTGKMVSPKSHYREAILGMNSAMLLAQGRELRTMAVTSSLPGEGKSTAAGNLAAALAGSGSRVVLVDADMRKPSAHRLFHVPNRLGLSALLRGKTSVDQALIVAPGAPNLYLIPAGALPASPAELLHAGLGSLLEDLQARFDHVILDCPPVLGFADALAVTNLVDGCVLIVHAGKTDRQLVAGSLRQLRSVRASILGIVLNNVSEGVNYYYSYYSAYSSYESRSESDETAEQETEADDEN